MFVWGGFMSVSESQKKARDKYDCEHFEYITLKVHKGQKAEMKTFAKKQGHSLNSFIVETIKECMEREKAAEVFIAPPGVWCPADCPKRGETILHNNTSPWCFAYGVEISDHDAGIDRYRKCAECLRNTK